MKGNNTIRVKANVVHMSSGAYILTLATAFLFGDALAVCRANRGVVKRYLEKLAKMEGDEDVSESGDDEE